MTTNEESRQIWEWYAKMDWKHPKYEPTEKEIATYGWMKIQCCDNCRYGEQYYEGEVRCHLVRECERVTQSTPEDDIPVSDWIYDCNGNDAKCDIMYPFALSWGSNHCRFWEPKTLKSD